MMPATVVGGNAQSNKKSRFFKERVFIMLLEAFCLLLQKYVFETLVYFISFAYLSELLL